MKTTIRTNVIYIIVIMYIVSLLFIPTAFCEQETWVCPDCGRRDNHGNYCGGCGHPAPWFENNTADIIEAETIPGFSITGPEFTQLVSEIFANSKQWNSGNFPYKQYMDFPLIPSIDLTTVQELRDVVYRINGTIDDEFHVLLSLDTNTTIPFDVLNISRNNSVDYYVNRWEDGTYWYGIQYMLSANNELFEYTYISWGFSKDEIIIQITSPDKDMMILFNPSNGKYKKMFTY